MMILTSKIVEECDERFRPEQVEEILSKICEITDTVA